MQEATAVVRQARSTRGNKLAALLKDSKPLVDDFWKQTDYFANLGDLEEDSEDFDFEGELGGKKEEDLDSFDDDFGEEEEDGDEETNDDGDIVDWELMAEDAKRAVLKKGLKGKIHKKKGVREGLPEPWATYGHRKRGLQDCYQGRREEKETGQAYGVYGLETTVYS